MAIDDLDEETASNTALTAKKTAGTTAAKSTAKKATKTKSGAKSTAKSGAKKGAKSAAKGGKKGAKPSSTKSKTAKGKNASATKKKTTKKKPMSLEMAAGSYDDEYGLKLFFQPIYLPLEKRIFGYECLLRVVDRQLGVLTPDVFLDVAKKSTTLMRGLEDWSMGELFRTARKFRERRKEIDMLSINIDTADIERKDFLERTKKYLEKIVDNIVFEFKEDVFFNENKDVYQRLKVLRQAGVKVAIDDFSADFLAFDWGMDTPFDIIKIERIYVDRLLTSPKSHLIIEKIVEFAKKYELDVIAVGVENSEQEQELLKMGVEKMQGYYYAKPLSIKRLIEQEEVEAPQTPVNTILPEVVRSFGGEMPDTNGATDSENNNESENNGGENVESVKETATSESAAVDESDSGNDREDESDSTNEDESDNDREEESDTASENEDENEDND